MAKRPRNTPEPEDTSEATHVLVEANEATEATGETQAQDAATQEATQEAQELNPRAVVGDNNPDLLRRKFMQRVHKYADAAGKGEQSLPALALDAVRMAAEGIIGIEKPAAGQQDDATRVYTAFQQRRSQARGAVYEKESSFTQQVSKFRQVVVLGATLFEDGVAVLQRATDLHTDAGNDEARRGDMRSGTLYAFLVDVAREQNKEERKGVPLTDEELTGLLFPGKGEKKSDIERVKAAIKGLEKLRDGTKGDDGHKPIDSEYITASITNMYELLYELDPSLREEAQRQEQLKLQAAALGFRVTKGGLKRAA